MKVLSLPVGMIQTNCYLFEGKNHIAAVVDPGTQGERILSLAQENGMDIRYILLTHGHFDHVCAANTIKPMTRTGLRAPGYNDDTVVPDQLVKEGDLLDIGGILIHVMETPGHTPGGITYRTEDGILFTGDTLFQGSMGRTDLAGGNQTQIMRSLRKLAALQGDFIVYPGHGPATSLEHERQTNPFMGEYYDSFD